MSSLRRSGRITAAAVAAVVITGLAAPSAFAAAPAQAPAAVAVAPSPDTPVKGGVLALDLAAALDLNAHGVVLAGVNGAVDLDAGVGLKVVAGSKLVHQNRKLVGGKLVLAGGIKLNKGAKSVLISNVSVDLATKSLWATVGAKVNVKLGTLGVRDTEVISGSGSVNADILVGGALHLDATAGAAIDAALDTCVFADADVEVGVGLNANVDLDVDLAVALGLDADVDIDLGIGGLLDADVDAHISLL
ncbi:hypothetical protein ABT160_03810 [Streptomyces sp. NPDC001941]|uniref:hypothetical protein n=1 Tax=Streptomyces sp. NPDC001941 TaxID=3154659 RepID=UPI00332EEB65